VLLSTKLAYRARKGYVLYTVSVKSRAAITTWHIMPSMAEKRRRPMQAEEMERVLAMLPKSAVEDLDRAAIREGLSRSALIRTVLLRYLRERAE